MEATSHVHGSEQTECLSKWRLETPHGAQAGRARPIYWPPRSPDLTAADYFLWDYIKDQMYRSSPPQ
jgi:hypothetical protein